MVAERVEEGVGRGVEVEDLPAGRDQREDARGGGVAGGDDGSVGARQLSDPAGEAGRSLGGVEDVLDIGVVNETDHSI